MFTRRGDPSGDLRIVWYAEDADWGGSYGGMREESHLIPSKGFPGPRWRPLLSIAGRLEVIASRLEVIPIAIDFYPTKKSTSNRTML